jgi:hypothetical protein
VGKGWSQAPSCELSFCCNSGSNGKTQPYYWLATDPTTKTRQRNKERKGKEEGKTKNKWAYRKLPTYILLNYNFLKELENNIKTTGIKLKQHFLPVVAWMVVMRPSIMPNSSWITCNSRRKTSDHWDTEWGVENFALILCVSI